VWVLVATGEIFLMQVGFAMLEAGTVRRKNSSNILLKNLLDTCVGAIAFYLVGYGLANEANGGILGTTHFVGLEFGPSEFLKWVF